MVSITDLHRVTSILDLAQVDLDSFIIAARPLVHSLGVGDGDDGQRQITAFCTDEQLTHYEMMLQQCMQ